MCTYCSPYVFIENIGTGIPSGSPIGIDVTSVLLETWCNRELQWAVYERNTPLVWAQVAQHLRSSLANLWGSEALQGEKANEAFVVTCNQSTMTHEDIIDGRVIYVVGIALVTPREFTFYRIHIQQKSW
jgi:Bacteriophage tail sheath protein